MAKLEWRGGTVAAAVESAVRSALREIGEDLKEKSLAQAPVESGRLKGSAFARQEADGVVVGYDDPEGYMAVQHERLDFAHPNGGKAKFLEDPFNENAARYERMVAEAVEKALG